MARSKSEYWLTPEGLMLIEGWARDGLTDEQIAHNIGIAPCTLYEWKNRYPEISEALKNGKEVVDRAVENALLKRALGYDYTEKRVETSASGNTKTITITKHIPGDTTAQIFWLKNRKPDAWRDRREVKEENEDDNTGCVVLPAVEGVHE